MRRVDTRATSSFFFNFFSSSSLFFSPLSLRRQSLLPAAQVALRFVPSHCSQGRTKTVFIAACWGREARKERSERESERELLFSFELSPLESILLSSLLVRKWKALERNRSLFSNEILAWERSFPAATGISARERTHQGSSYPGILREARETKRLRERRIPPPPDKCTAEGRNKATERAFFFFFFLRRKNHPPHVLELRPLGGPSALPQDQVHQRGELLRSRCEGSWDTRAEIGALA